MIKHTKELEMLAIAKYRRECRAEMRIFQQPCSVTVTRRYIQLENSRGKLARYLVGGGGKLTRVRSYA